jgi:DNA-binding MarR family transcriptional regulator
MDDFDVSGIDEVIHGRLRLGIMAFLTGAESADFTTIRDRLKTTDGNLSVHLRKLEDAGYLAIKKTFADRKPLTVARLTPKGRKAFKTYLEALSPIIDTGLNGAPGPD